MGDGHGLGRLAGDCVLRLDGLVRPEAVVKARRPNGRCWLGAEWQFSIKRDQEDTVHTAGAVRLAAHRGHRRPKYDRSDAALSRQRHLNLFLGFGNGTRLGRNRWFKRASYSQAY
jgi:hypothetical protein